jgi:transcriptional regulator with XRE-family HTH domain
MNGQRLGGIVRAVRIRRGLRQQDLALRGGVSQSTISRVEAGHMNTLTIRHLETVLAALDIRLDVVARWRGGDLERLLNARHSALHDAIARWLRRRRPDAVLQPEATFSIYGERGSIDLLVWLPAERALLVIELKTELVDLNELAGTLDRKRRLAPQIARERGWEPRVVGVWLVVQSSRTNRQHVQNHRAFIRSALPDDGRAVRRWLARPHRNLAACSLESFGAALAPARRRVGPRRRR